jgi:hypothetical protein
VFPFFVPVSEPPVFSRSVSLSPFFAVAFFFAAAFFFSRVFFSRGFFCLQTVVPATFSYAVFVGRQAPGFSPNPP